MHLRARETAFPPPLAHLQLRFDDRSREPRRRVRGAGSDSADRAFASDGSATSLTNASAAANIASSLAPCAARSLRCPRHHARRCVGKSRRSTARANCDRAGERNARESATDRAAPTSPNEPRLR
eukprot:31354-Pelagococcus_subviridis.AAC.13